MASENRPPTRRDDEFPSELPTHLLGDAPIDRPTDRLVRFQAESPIARIHDSGNRGVDMLFSHDDRDATGFFSAAARPRNPWFAIVVALLFGSVLGFASGYTTAQRFAEPRMAVMEVTHPAEEAVAPLSSPDLPSSGSSGTDSDGDEDAPSGPVSLTPPPAVVEPITRTESRSSVRPQGSIEIVSRPSGAQVTLDGRVVGRTPLSLADVPRGSHVVGIELAGYKRWATSVLVTSDRARVGASLELIVPQEGP